jgi:hypothetical protein
MDPDRAARATRPEAAAAKQHRPNETTRRPSRPRRTTQCRDSTTQHQGNTHSHQRNRCQVPRCLVPRTSGDTTHRCNSGRSSSCGHRGLQRKNPQQQPDGRYYLPSLGIGCRSKEHLCRDAHQYGRDTAKLRSLPIGHLASHTEDASSLYAQQPTPLGRHTSYPDCQEVHLASSTPNRNYAEIVRLTLFGRNYHNTCTPSFYRPSEGFL